MSQTDSRLHFLNMCQLWWKSEQGFFRVCKGQSQVYSYSTSQQKGSSKCFKS